MNIPTRAEVNQLIADKLATDPGFREALLADPRAALAEVIGVEIPDFLTVSVPEESLTDVHLVIPTVSGDEIAEDDLELVAGGALWNEACRGCICEP